jgi:SAM-dependent methyltransferase
MFAPDIVNLKQFYATPLGESAQALIGQTIRSFWPQAAGDALLGIGFPTPYLHGHLDSGAPVVVCMPGAQGAAYWPSGKFNLVFLGNEAQLPLKEASVNRILLVHCLEHTEQLSWLMQEAWRVLIPGGRVLAVAPNRLGFWSRSSRSPFGYGRPFSMAQLRALFTEQQFTIMRTQSALFTPPLYWQWLWRISGHIEILGKLLCRPLGGVLFLEAEKQVYAAIRQPEMARKTYRSAPVLPVFSR